MPVYVTHFVCKGTLCNDIRICPEINSQHSTDWYLEYCSNFAFTPITFSVRVQCLRAEIKQNDLSCAVAYCQRVNHICCSVHFVRPRSFLDTYRAFQVKEIFQFFFQRN